MTEETDEEEKRVDTSRQRSRERAERRVLERQQWMRQQDDLRRRDQMYSSGIRYVYLRALDGTPFGVLAIRLLDRTLPEGWRLFEFSASFLNPRDEWNRWEGRAEARRYLNDPSLGRYLVVPEGFMRRDVLAAVMRYMTYRARDAYCQVSTHCMTPDLLAYNEFHRRVIGCMAMLLPRGSRVKLLGRGDLYCA